MIFTLRISKFRAGPETIGQYTSAFGPAVVLNLSSDGYRLWVRSKMSVHASAASNIKGAHSPAGRQHYGPDQAA